MVGCELSQGMVYYIDKLEDFRDLIDWHVYDALVEFVEKEYVNKINELEEEVEELKDNTLEER